MDESIDAVALQHPGTTKRVVPNMEWVVFHGADNHMVEQVDPDDSGCLPQLAGKLDVGRTRRRVSAFTKSGSLGYERRHPYQGLTPFLS
jgi:hypothetical protein